LINLPQEEEEEETEEAYDRGLNQRICREGRLRLIFLRKKRRKRKRKCMTEVSTKEFVLKTDFDKSSTGGRGGRGRGSIWQSSQPFQLLVITQAINHHVINILPLG
jgi:hypothetical protein